MPQDRKALTGIEQIGDTRAKVPLARVVENNFFNKLMGVATCNIVETLFW